MSPETWLAPCNRESDRCRVKGSEGSFGRQADKLLFYAIFVIFVLVSLCPLSVVSPDSVRSRFGNRVGIPAIRRMEYVVFMGYAVLNTVGPASSRRLSHFDDCEPKQGGHREIETWPFDCWRTQTCKRDHLGWRLYSVEILMCLLHDPCN